MAPVVVMDTEAVPGRAVRAAEADRPVKLIDAVPATAPGPDAGARAVKLIDATPAFTTVCPVTLACCPAKITEEAPGSTAREADTDRPVKTTEAAPGRPPTAAREPRAVKVMELVAGSAERPAEAL